MGINKFIGICSEHQTNVFDFVYSLIKRKKPTILTLEQSINRSSSVHQVLEEKDLDRIRQRSKEGGGEMHAGLLYALETRTPLFFIDGSYERGYFEADFEHATTLNLTESEITLTGLPQKLIVYNGEIEIPDRGYKRDGEGNVVDIIFPTEEEYNRSLPERNRFTKDCINRIADSRDIDVLVHIAGGHHFDLDMYGRVDQFDDETKEKFVPLHKLVNANEKEVIEAVIRETVYRE